MAHFVIEELINTIFCVIKKAHFTDTVICRRYRIEDRYM